jgi:putative phosphoribosyl transferase
VALQGRPVIVVDDGLATGSTMRAAVGAARAAGAGSVVVGVPVGSAPAVEQLQREADDVVCPLVPDRFFAVGSWYDDFGQVPDEVVVATLAGRNPS